MAVHLLGLTAQPIDRDCSHVFRFETGKFDLDARASWLAITVPVAWERLKTACHLSLSRHEKNERAGKWFRIGQVGRR
jgi:hypothetical protein